MSSAESAGAYRSTFKGQGLDFAELDEYSPGDDVRHIDWNATGRMGKPFVRRYHEEREGTVMLVVKLGPPAFAPVPIKPVILPDPLVGSGN